MRCAIWTLGHHLRRFLIVAVVGAFVFFPVAVQSTLQAVAVGYDLGAIEVVGVSVSVSLTMTAAFALTYPVKVVAVTRSNFH
jgi:hypothetical protein